jgi:chemotaxis protein MotA
MAEKKVTAGAKLSFDFGSLGGVALAVGGILTGLILDGGAIADVRQVNAALIVFGGTLGAVILSTPLAVLASAVKKLSRIFVAETDRSAATLEEIIKYAVKARRQGIVSLEQEADAIADPFLRKAFNLAIDGVDTNQIRSLMELEIEISEQKGEAEAKIFESAGGYAPTIGIIGAVLGLMQVMKHLADIDNVGRGIATAFVATVYGVGSANLFFLPAAEKLRARLRAANRVRELMLEGVLAIAEGLNPKLIRTKLDAYLPPAPSPRKAPVKTPAPASGHAVATES